MPPTENRANSSDVLQKLGVPLAIVIAGALVAGAIYFSNSSGAAEPGTGAPKAVNVKDVKIGAGDPYIGDTNAPITLAYWSDFQCPFCKAVEVGGVQGIAIEPSIPMLIKDYVDTGKLRIVFKDFPFLGEDSITAALYEHAVWDSNPNTFYAWREAMFKAQDDEGDQGFGDEASIIALIRKIPGLDADALKAKVVQNRDAYLKLIEDDRSEGAAFGVSGTPGFITGTKFIGGADQPATFKAAIEEQL